MSYAGIALVLTPVLALKRTTILSSLDAARLVVISRTPLAPLAPYKAPADASLSTDIDSISLALIELSSPSKGTPSTTRRGELEAFMEPKPRILMEEPLPGCPLPEVVITPET